jgi:hypothetical protein
VSGSPSQPFNAGSIFGKGTTPGGEHGDGIGTWGEGPPPPPPQITPTERSIPSK